jgi:hyperosmotically inducible periplasmic protein
MPRKSGVMVLAVLGSTLAFGNWGSADPPRTEPAMLLAQQTKGTGETIGAKVEQAVEGLKREVRATGESLHEQYEKARAAVHGMSVQARVYSRLHWDKDLNDSKLELEVKDGTVILRGAVKSLVAKVKAAELSRDTVGVARVEDHLTIEPVVPVVEPRPAAKAKS